MKGEDEKMPHGFRETLQFYLIDCRTAMGKIIDIFIIVLNLFICAIFLLKGNIEEKDMVEIVFINY